MNWTKRWKSGGHRFVRYADDCSIYVRSRKSAQRVMESITGYLEDELKLRVNRGKSKVSRPTASTLLGFSFYGGRQGWNIRIAPKSLKSIKQKLKEQTKRNHPIGLSERIVKLESVIRGWVNYFSKPQPKVRCLNWTKWSVSG